MAGGILTSSQLIASIKRRGFIPESQETYTARDFLEMATEEINISLMDQIIETRGDYLVYYIDIPLVQFQYEYPIPSRAQGNKLRDVVIMDQQNTVVYEMMQVSIEELSDYQGYYSVNTRQYFYMQNNNVVLPQGNILPNYKMRMYFYMRPNSLVVEDRGAAIRSVMNVVEVNNIAPKSGSVTHIAIGGIVTAVGHGLNDGDLVQFSGTDCTPTIDGNRVITYIDPDTYSVDVAVTIAGNSGNWNLALLASVLTFSTLPVNFNNSIQYDVVQYKSPNKIIAYDLYPNNVNNNLKTISIPAGILTSLNVGDYVTQAEETIVPNMPTEYHPIIAQRVAVACMEGMADPKAFELAAAKLAKMEASVLRMVANRVEGAPKKLKNRHGTLQAALSGNYPFRWRN